MSFEEDDEFLELGELRINPRGGNADGSYSPSSGSATPSGHSTPTTATPKASSLPGSGPGTPSAKTGTKKKQVTLEGRKRKKKKKRDRRWMKGWGNLSLRDTRIFWFLLSEAILAIIVSVSLFVQNSQLLELYAGDAESQLRFLDSTYILKPSLMLVGYLALSINSFVQQFLSLPTELQANSNTPLYASVKTALDYELEVRQLEFSMLLNATGHIVASANTERQLEATGSSRFGEFFNPGGLVERAIARASIPRYQIHKSLILPVEDVRVERPPTFRERELEFLPTGPFHWTDVDTDVVLRIVLTNVNNPADGSLLGILVAGDVLNGKIPVAYDVVNAMGRQAGFAGVYALDRQKKNWLPASLYRRIFTDLLTGDDTDIDDAAFGPVTDRFLDDAYRIDATADQEGSVGMKDNNMLLAGRRVPPTIETTPTGINYNFDDQSDAVLIRGIDLTAFDIFDEVLFLALLGIGVVVAADLVSLLVALNYLIEPLEKLMSALRRKIPVTLDDVEKVNVGPTWVLLMILMNLPGVIVVALIIVWNAQALDDALISSAESRVGAYTLTHNLKIDQMSLNGGGDANQAAIQGLLADPNNPQFRAITTQIMKVEQNINFMEFATVLDADGLVLLSPNADRRGERLDPFGIVNRTLETGNRQVWTRRITYDDFAAEDPPIFLQRNDAPPSALSMNNTRENGIARWVTTLVDSDSDGRPEGILLFGDVVNGKTAITERNLRVTGGKGYDAIYMKDYDGRWILCSSVLRYTSSDRIRVDVEFPYKSMLQDALDAETEPVSRLGSLEDLNFIFAAQAIPINFQVSSDSGEKFDVESEVFVVAINGIPTTEADEIKRDTLLFGIGNLIIQVITSIIGIHLAFDPVRKSIIVLKKYGILKKDAHDTVLGMMFGPFIAYIRSVVETVQREGCVEPIARKFRRATRHLKKQTHHVVSSVKLRPRSNKTRDPGTPSGATSPRD
eukprot:scaffold1239_cov175-Pinguiococcus_pyrenoidosus.AAC.28